MITLTQARLHEVLDYDPRIGIFRWRMARSNVKAGDVAGSLDKDGYRQISFNRRMYKAGRLAWLYVHGRWPKHEIDHKNGVRDDNLIKNLRDVTRSGNSQNQRKAKSDSKTGLLGAFPFRRKFQSQINIDGKRLHLGLFATAKEAHDAYVAAKRQFHPTCTI